MAPTLRAPALGDGSNGFREGRSGLVPTASLWFLVYEQLADPGARPVVLSNVFIPKPKACPARSKWRAIAELEKVGADPSEAAPASGAEGRSFQYLKPGTIMRPIWQNPMRPIWLMLDRTIMRPNWLICSPILFSILSYSLISGGGA